MTAFRIVLAVLLALAVYFAVAVEAVIGGRTLMPHAPAVVLIVAAWFLPTTPAVLVAAAIGLGCDAIGTRTFGPGLITAVAAAALGSTLRLRWRLESLLAMVVFGIAVAMTLIAGPILVETLFGAGIAEPPRLQIEVARATSSAMAALAVTLIVRMAGATRRITSTVWNA